MRATASHAGGCINIPVLAPWTARALSTYRPALSVCTPPQTGTSRRTSDIRTAGSASTTSCATVTSSPSPSQARRLSTTTPKRALSAPRRRADDGYRHRRTEPSADCKKRGWAHITHSSLQRRTLASHTRHHWPPTTSLSLYCLPGLPLAARAIRHRGRHLMRPPRRAFSVRHLRSLPSSRHAPSARQMLVKRARRVKSAGAPECCRESRELSHVLLARGCGIELRTDGLQHGVEMTG